MNNLFHICLVSKQAMPNIIPAILYKPEKVILLTTKEEYKTAENISIVLSKYEVECEIFKDFVSAYDLNSVSDSISKILNIYSNKILTLNITGGTKLMAIAAYEIFRNQNLNIIYCDTFDDNIIHFKNGEIISEKYSNLKISVEDYLNAYGFKEDESQNKTKSFRNIELINFIKDHFDEFIEFSTAVRLVIPENENQFVRSIGDFEFERRNNKMFLSYQNREIFQSEYTNFNYLVGLWLEDFVYDYLKTKFPDEDIRKSFNILSTSDSANEVDIIFSKKGKLYLVSCKTGKYDKKDLFELEGLRNLAGGTFSKAYKVIIKNDKLSENISKRAKEMNIKLLTVHEFKNEEF